MTTNNPNLAQSYTPIGQEKTLIMSVLSSLTELENDLLQAMSITSAPASGPTPVPTGANTSGTTETFGNYNLIEGFDTASTDAALATTPVEDIQTANADATKFNSDLKSDKDKVASIQTKLHHVNKQIAKTQNDINKEEDKLRYETQEVPQSNPSYIESVDKLKTLAQMRIQLLEALLAMYAQMTNNTAQAKSNLADQLTLQEVAVQNIHNAKTTLASLNHSKTANQRLAEINTYYAKEYQARTGVMKVLVFTCIPLLIIVLLKKYKILPDSAANILSFTVFLIGLIVFITKVTDLSDRSNMNFDQYDFSVGEGGYGKHGQQGDGNILQYDANQLKKLWTGARNYGDHIGTHIDDETKYVDHNIQKNILAAKSP